MLQKNKVLNDYIDVENLLNEYFNAEESENKKNLLQQLLFIIRPLIIASCKHYYGITTEDLIQDGYEKAIKLIYNYDVTLTEVKFLGYMKRMLMCYYWDKKRAELKNTYKEVSDDNLEERGYKEQGFDKVELKDILGILSERERQIVVLVYIKGYRQKSVANDLGLSLAYVKEVLYKSRKKMREVINC
ncbi:MAG: sigma-70 family RNA polymerase sigma factor [Filifactoraceae bacterium]